MLKKGFCLALLLLVLGYLSLGCSTPEQESGGVDVQKPREEETTLEQPITLRFAFFAPAHTFPGVHMEEWAKRIEERTQGRVNVETFPGGTLLQALNMYDGVSEGVADIGLSCPSYEPGRFPLFAIMDLPLGLDRKSVG